MRVKYVLSHSLSPNAAPTGAGRLGDGVRATCMLVAGTSPVVRTGRFDIAAVESQAMAPLLPITRPSLDNCACHQTTQFEPVTEWPSAILLVRSDTLPTDDSCGLKSTLPMNFGRPTFADAVPRRTRFEPLVVTSGSVPHRSRSNYTSSHHRAGLWCAGCQSGHFETNRVRNHSSLVKSYELNSEEFDGSG